MNKGFRQYDSSPKKKETGDHLSMSYEFNADKLRSSVLLYALGDAWGYTVEFDTYRSILKKQPGVPSLLTISDDTQMSLYTMEALQTAEAEGIDIEDIVDNEDVSDKVRKFLADAYLDFFCDPDNYRAPGMTCMGSLSDYAAAKDDAEFLNVELKGDEGNTNKSLGCGTIMRSPWLGFLGYNRETIVALNVLHSQVTHGNPVGWLVSAVSSLMSRDLANGVVGEKNIFAHAIELVEEIESMNFELAEQLASAIPSVKGSLKVYLSSWDRIEVALAAKPDAPRFETDLNEVFGEGWTAHESLYNALASFQLYQGRENVFSGVKRLVYSNGDSDSIAAIGGAFFGAQYGIAEQTQRVLMSKLEPRYRYEIKNMFSFVASTHEPK